VKHVEPKTLTLEAFSNFFRAFLKPVRFKTRKFFNILKAGQDRVESAHRPVEDRKKKGPRLTPAPDSTPTQPPSTASCNVYTPPGHKPDLSGRSARSRSRSGRRPSTHRSVLLLLDVKGNRDLG
jgi:hypothetical protein